MFLRFGVDTMALLSSGNPSLVILGLMTILLLAFSVSMFSGDFAALAATTTFLDGGPSLVMILTEWMDS